MVMLILMVLVPKVRSIAVIITNSGPSMTIKVAVKLPEATGILTIGTLPSINT